MNGGSHEGALVKHEVEDEHFPQQAWGLSIGCFEPMKLYRLASLVLRNGRAFEGTSKQRNCGEI